MSRETVDPTSCAFLYRGQPQPKSGVLRRLAQWIWSAWPVDPDSSSPAGIHPDPTPDPDDRNYTVSTGRCGNPRAAALATPRYLPSPNDPPVPEVSSYPCKACRTWGVACDRQQPHCSHCLDQQILCFYIRPPRKMVNRKKARVGVVVTDGQSIGEVPIEGLK